MTEIDATRRDYSERELAIACLVRIDGEGRPTGSAKIQCITGDSGDTSFIYLTLSIAQLYDFHRAATSAIARYEELKGRQDA